LARYKKVNRERVTIAGAILAGGKARRFGNRPKGLLELPGAGTIMGRLLEEMENAGLARRVICANDEQLYAGLGVPVVPDLHAGSGPLGGIEAGLRHFKDSADAVLFLPCDTPNVTAREIRQLCAQFDQSADRIMVVETGDGVWHPLCSVVPVVMYDNIARAVQNGHLSVKRLWRDLGAASTRFENSGRFADANSPEEFEAAIQAAAADANTRVKTAKPDTEGETMPVTITVPDTVHGKITEFLKSENIALEATSGTGGKVKVVPGEQRRECSSTVLYPGGWIKCPVAWTLSKRLSISYGEVGKILNFFEIKIRDCALGCF
jgi:molybdopterin-guanine dinucleotide biosynthesis protein A